MRGDGDNRAVSALFRGLGGQLRLPVADVNWPATGEGLHRPEMIVLGSLVTLVASAAVLERLWAWWGGVWAIVLLLPAVFVALHAVAFLLGPPARWCTVFGGTLEGWRWRVWAVVYGGWAAWAVARGGWPAVFGWAWLGLLGCNVPGLLVLGWRASMGLSGWPGISVRVVFAIMLHLPMLWFALSGEFRGAIAWGALMAALFCRGTLSAKSGCFGPVVTRVQGRGVWLTIDDGPDPSTTPALLDLLDRHRVQATFFVIGEKVRRHPELAREIIARGHSLGNHTATHPVATFWCAGPWRTLREIEACSRAIREAAGVDTVWFRAPVGHRNYFTHPFAARGGMRVVGWNRRGLDGVSTKVPEILGRLLDKVADGDVLVTHDSTPVAVEVLQGVLEGLSERGIGVGDFGKRRHRDHRD